MAALVTAGFWVDRAVGARILQSGGAVHGSGVRGSGASADNGTRCNGSTNGTTGCPNASRVGVGRPPKAWFTFRNHDFLGADALRMSATNLTRVRREVEARNWTGFVVHDGFAFLKGPTGPKAKRDLTLLGPESGYRFFLFAWPEEIRLSNAPACGSNLPTWTVWPHYDIPNAADLGKMSALDLKVVKRIVEENRYAGFSVFNNVAFLKDRGLPLRPGDLKNMGSKDPVVFYAFSPFLHAGASPEMEMERTFYIYRAQSDLDYLPTNVNAADIAGVLWYLHHEIVPSSGPRTPGLCRRRHGVTRIVRTKVTARRPPLLTRPGFFFSSFVTFDSGSCSTPDCSTYLASVGYMPGCKSGLYGGLAFHWYSFPGQCPDQAIPQKTPECTARVPGGYCACDQPLGTKGCTYQSEPAGELFLDELVGISDFDEFCAAGKEEYNLKKDAGTGTGFWNGVNDSAMARKRVQAVLDLFHHKYPHTPRHLGSQYCEDVHR